MQKIASAAIQELAFDCTVTLVSSGASKNFAIAIVDKPRDSYFLLGLTCEPSARLLKSSRRASKTNSVDDVPPL